MTVILSKYRWFTWMVRDSLFIPIENIDYDCFISTGKCISAKSSKNKAFTPHVHSDMGISLPFNLIKDNGSPPPDLDAESPDDREDLPFIHSHPIPFDSGDQSHSTHSTHSRSPHVRHSGTGKKVMAMKSTMKSVQQRLQSHTNLPVS